MNVPCKVNSSMHASIPSSPASELHSRVMQSKTWELTAQNLVRVAHCVQLDMCNSKGNTCLPVQRGLGLMIAGIGTTPSQSSSHMRMFMNTSFSMKVSRLVISRQPNRVSCTMPITGLFACMSGSSLEHFTSSALLLLAEDCHSSLPTIYVDSNINISITESL